MTEINKVRLRIGDLDSQIFTSDDYIQEFLDANDDDVLLACSDACRAIAAEASLLAVAEKVGGYSIDRKTIAQHYMTLADKYQTQAVTAPYSGVIEMTVSEFAEDQIIENEALRG